MEAKRTYAEENAAELQQLRALVARLSAADLACPLGGGWTVAMALAHLAFWDRRRRAQMQQWARTGVEPVAGDSGSINAAVEVLAAAIPPQGAASLAIEAAEAVDGEVAQLPAEVIAAIERAGAVSMLRRATHRREHIEQIERGLRGG